MSHPITRRTALVTVAASAIVAALPRQTLAATTHEIQMLNQHPEDKKLKMVFYPRIVVAEPGDTISFVATDKGHNSQTIDGMAPEGAATWKGKINNGIEVTLDKPGFYGFQCAPHSALGMVGLVIVKGDGMMDNLEAAKAVKQRGKAEGAWNDIWAEVEGMDLSA